MIYLHKNLKKSFGRYRAVDVDICLAELERLLTERDARIEDLDRQISTTKQALELADAQREEAFKARDNMAKSCEDGLREADETRRELSEEREAARALREENETLADQCRSLAEDARGQAQQLLTLRTDLDQANRQLDTAQDELTLSRVQVEHLIQRVADQRREIERTEQILMKDPVGEANRRAEKIIEDAMATSQKMMDDAENVRSQALAAVRAAYFNAMGFRQTVEERFTNLEHELDRSMGSLRALQLTDHGYAVNFLEDQRDRV